MHQVEYMHTQFSFPNPLNSSKYVGITDDVDNAWMEIAFRKPLSSFSLPSSLPHAHN
jgi:hypothetical protein